MRIELLNEFIVLARTLSYSEAASALFITQPTLSKHIRDLENDLGAQLFVRTTKRVELTPIGHALLPRAIALMGIYHDIRRTVQEASSHGVRLATGLRYSTYCKLLMRARSAFEDLVPDIPCIILDTGREARPHEIIGTVCDVTINLDADLYCSGGLASRRIALARMRVWASNNGLLSQRDTVSIRELASMVYRPAMTDTNDPWQLFVSQMFASFGIAPEVGAVCDDQYQLGPADFGLVFAGNPTEFFGYNARLVELEEEVLVPVAAIWSAGCTDPYVHQIVDVLEQVAKELF